MITIIAGTNRPSSKTEIVAQEYHRYIKENANEEVQYFSLQNLPTDILHSNMYSPDGQSKALAEIQDSILIPASKWLVILPEYNGSYPGIFKLFIDAVSIRQKEDTFKDKKLALVGVASGRAGNLRGLDQMTNSMHYLGFSVFRSKLPLSLVGTLLNEDLSLKESTEKLIHSHAKSILEF